MSILRNEDQAHPNHLWVSLELLVSFPLALLQVFLTTSKEHLYALLNFSLLIEPIQKTSTLAHNRCAFVFQNRNLSSYSFAKTASSIKVFKLRVDKFGSQVENTKRLLGQSNGSFIFCQGAD